MNKNLNFQSEKYLSDIRLFRYYEIASDEPLKMYLINLEVSEKIFGIISLFEVILRNKIHIILSTMLGSDYLTNQQLKIFNKHELQLIQKAIYKASQKNIQIKESKILSLLTLGFWCELPQNNYLWCKYLYKLFSKDIRKKNNIKIIKKNFSFIAELRNKIAHHERIINKPNICIKQSLKCISDMILWLIDEEDKDFFNYMKEYLLKNMEEIKKDLEKLKGALG